VKKKIREFGFEITNKTSIYEKALADLEGRRNDLDAKKAELGTITAETQKEENELTAQADKATISIDERLLIAYNRFAQQCKKWPGSSNHPARFMLWLFQPDPTTTSIGHTPT